MNVILLVSTKMKIQREIILLTYLPAHSRIYIINMSKGKYYENTNYNVSKVT